MGPSKEVEGQKVRGNWEHNSAIELVADGKRLKAGRPRQSGGRATEVLGGGAKAH